MKSSKKGCQAVTQVSSSCYATDISYTTKSQRTTFQDRITSDKCPFLFIFKLGQESEENESTGCGDGDGETQMAK
jgi:hypothetical protein